MEIGLPAILEGENKTGNIEDKVKPTEPIMIPNSSILEVDDASGEINSGKW